MAQSDAEILDGIIRREGGYVNHPADKGGPTKYGITLATLRAWRKQPTTAEDVKALTLDEAREIYRARYIAPFAEETDPDVREQLIDIAVNSGVTNATKLLHRALENRRARSLSNQLAIERLKFYGRIVQGNPSQAVFLSGWINRAAEFIR